MNNAINEIIKRHPNGYQKVIDSMVLQIKKFHRIHSPNGKLLIGISGGIDSTVVATLAKKAVGNKNLILLYLPSIENKEELKYFSCVKDFIKAEETYHIDIKTSTNNVINKTKNAVGRDLDKITKGNIAARIRVNLFYAIAREKNAFVLGTSNRTEFLQGYATKYGTPISCDFGILDELYKTDIYEIAKILNIPKNILQRKSTTGFFIGQTHEEELGGSMEKQDAAAYLLFEKKMPIHLIHKQYGLSREYLIEFKNKFEKSLHKRILQQNHINLGYIK